MLLKALLAHRAQLCSPENKRWRSPEHQHGQGRRWRMQLSVQEHQALQKWNHFSQTSPFFFLITYFFFSTHYSNSQPNFFLLLQQKLCDQWELHTQLLQNWAPTLAFTSSGHACSYRHAGDTKVNFSELSVEVLRLKILQSRLTQQLLLSYHNSIAL